MELLTSSHEISEAVIRLLTNCASCDIAVAWASYDFDAFEVLKRKRDKINRMIVGTHFGQTHPEFIEEFMSDTRVKFVPESAELFHPKIYLFTRKDGGSDFLIGSANFTTGGFAKNMEVAALITPSDGGYLAALGALRARLDQYWTVAIAFDAPTLAQYRQVWARNRSFLARSRRAARRAHHEGDGIRNAEGSILTMSWPDYFGRLGSKRSLPGRLRTLAEVRAMFGRSPHFVGIPLQDREKIAGLVRKGGGPGTDFWWFGRMRPTYLPAVIEGDELSAALDEVPLYGDVTKEAYMRCVAGLRRAFAAGGLGVATASRLLAMRRPDVFVCLDRPNRDGIAADLEIERIPVVDQDLERYWDTVILAIQRCEWWLAAEPIAQTDEHAAWLGRTALLDTLYYEAEDTVQG